MPISRTIYKAFTTAHTACCVGIGALMLTSCSTPPKPPSVDESTKRPVNARVAVDLKACQGDLSRATILVSEMARAGVVATALTKAQPLPAGASTSAADPGAADATGNLVAVVPFGMVPAPLADPVMAYDSNRSVAVLFAGQPGAAGPTC